MKPLSPMLDFFVQLIGPLLILKTMVPTMMSAPDVNTICGKPMSGKKTAGFDYSLDLAKMKAYCKKKECTINDYTTSILSCALQAYFKEEEKEGGKDAIPTPESVHVTIPFSFRQPVANIQDIKMCNDFGGMLLDMKLFGNINEAIPHFKSLFYSMKGSLDMFGILLMTKLTASLPFSLSKMVTDDFTSK